MNGDGRPRQLDPTERHAAPKEPTLYDTVREAPSVPDVPSNGPTRTLGGVTATNPGALRQHRGFCIALVGAPDVGKTTLAATIRNSRFVGANAGKRIALLDIEGGSFVLDDYDDIDVYEIKDAAALDRTTQKLIQNPGEYNGCIIDNMAEVLSLYGKKHEGKKNQPYGAFWVDVGDDVLAIVRGMRNLARARQFFSVFVLWDTGVTEEETKKKHREIQLTPKLAEKFLGVIDVLGYLERPPKPLPPFPPVLHFDRDPMYPTKMRVNPRQQNLLKLPNIVYQPDLGHVIDTVIGGDPWLEEQHRRRGG